MARKQGFLNRTILTVGFIVGRSVLNPYAFSKAQLRAMLVNLKQDYPEMPGISLYGRTPGNQSDPRTFQGVGDLSDTATIDLIRYAGLLAMELWPPTDRPAAAQTKSDGEVWASWSNTETWRDTSGNLLQTGEGNLLHGADGVFYLYGNRYRCLNNSLGCFGKVFGTTFSLYTSTDLMSWTLNTTSVFPMMDAGPFNSSVHAYAIPFVLYNAKFEHYVLWFTGSGFPGTNVTMWSAVSKQPQGPFVMVDKNPSEAVPVHGQFHGTQMDFWVHGDEAYMHHNMAGHGEGHVGQAVTKLSEDFLHATPEFTFLELDGTHGFLEGGGLFERQGRWYMMAGTPCCLCNTGASAQIFMAPHPLGPWADTGINLNAPVSPTTNYSECGFRRPTCTYEIRAQQFGVLGLGEERLYIGQRYGSAALKCEDGQYWQPMTFDEDGLPLPMKKADRVTVKLPNSSRVAKSDDVTTTTETPMRDENGDPIDGAWALGTEEEVLPSRTDNADFVIDTTSKGLPLSGEANGLLHA